MATTRRLIPDLDDELWHALGQVEEFLLTVAVWEEDPDDPAEFAAPLAGRVALAALNRVQTVIGPTQTVPGRPKPAGGRLLGAGGRYEHRPLRLVTVDGADLDTLAAVMTELNRALSLDPYGELTEASVAGAEAASGHTGLPVEPARVVQMLSRILGVLDLAESDDTAQLTRVIDASDGQRDLVLTPSADSAYRRAAYRFNQVWADGRAVDRYLY